MSGRGGGGEYNGVKPEQQAVPSEQECHEEGKLLADTLKSVNLQKLNSLDDRAAIAFVQGLGLADRKILALAEMINKHRIGVAKRNLGHNS